MPMKKRGMKGIFALGTGSTTPSDSTDYYLPGSPGTPVVSVTGTHFFTMQEPGVISKIFVNWYATTTAGSNENISCYLKVNGGAEYLIATIGTLSKLKEFTNVNMCVPLVIGDYFEILLRCPAWAVNPDGVRIGGCVIYV